MLSWFFIVAIGQGLFLSLFLATTRQPELRLANRLLAVLVMVFVLIIGHAALSVHGLFGDYPHAAAAVAVLPLLTGPLLLLYLRSLLHGARLSRRALPHFAPFLLALLAWTPYYVLPAADKLALRAAQSHIPLLLSAFALVKALHFAGYMVISYRLVAHASRARPDEPLIAGLRRLTVLLAAGLALDAVLLAIEHVHEELPMSSDTWGALVLIGFVYGLALLSMRVPLGYRPRQAAPLEPPAVRASASLLSPAERDKFLQDLTRSMEHGHAYRDGELTLDALASRLAMSAHELSQLINQSCGVNFQEYLNRYRVEALKLAMRDPQRAPASILDLALAAGFNSKSSMNRAFKKHTGTTPSEFRRLETVE